MNDFGKTLVLAVWLGGVCVGVLGTMTAALCSGNLKLTVKGSELKDSKKKDNDNTQPAGA